jgi:long-chain acyl-CoA synthetase
MYPGTHAKTQPDKLAVIRPATGESLTYRELNDRSNQLAQLFHAHGLRKGDHVAMFSENNLAYFEAVWACQRSGLYMTSINRYLTAAEAAYIVDNCDATVLIASANLAESEELGRLSPRCELKLAVGGSLEGFTDYEAALTAQPAQPLAKEHVGAFMLYSSGTTGKPKGILRPLVDRDPVDGNPGLEIIANLWGFDSSTVYLSPAPMYHSAPIGYSAAVIIGGGTVVMMDKFEPELALELIEKHRITHSQWVPTMFVRMLKLDPQVRAKYDLSSHRCAIHAAAPCPIEVKRQMIEWWGPIIHEYYAATENVGLATVNSEEWLAHPGSVGKARLRPFHICDEDGKELGPGEPGLIYGESNVEGLFAYHKDDGKTAGSTHPTNPAWMTVGDVGYLDADGYLYLTDRKAFMIISGGVNIYPQQIEDALALHPKVADVAVIGVPNPDLGEEVKAVVEPAPGVEPSDALAQEIMDFVRGKLGKQLTPRSVDFTDALPRLPTGKLYKKALRDQYWGAGSAALPLAARS